MSYWMPKIMHNQLKIQTKTQVQNQKQMWTQYVAEKKDANLDAKKYVKLETKKDAKLDIKNGAKLDR